MVSLLVFTHNYFGMPAPRTQKCLPFVNSPAYPQSVTGSLKFDKNGCCAHFWQDATCSFSGKSEASQWEITAHSRSVRSSRRLSPVDVRELVDGGMDKPAASEPNCELGQRVGKLPYPGEPHSPHILPSPPLRPAPVRPVIRGPLVSSGDEVSLQDRKSTRYTRYHAVESAACLDRAARCLSHPPSRGLLATGVGDGKTLKKNDLMVVVGKNKKKKKKKKKEEEEEEEEEEGGRGWGVNPFI
ncbi:unnamed protein product [Schistocephalus solidus]|uniref:Uncharacterized protein n=1 Tax=Schistocephalus solidus TaxID=70667 RepID=A0A183SMM7_SCHSO|nr:unnamed protein product [Schistocephalus solidus]